MKPVRWHCSTTSLKTTSHGPFFPPVLFWPGCRMSLNRRKEALPFIFSLRADMRVFVWRCNRLLLHKKSRWLRCGQLLYSIHVFHASESIISLHIREIQQRPQLSLTMCLVCTAKLSISAQWLVVARHFCRSSVVVKQAIPHRYIYLNMSG